MSEPFLGEIRIFSFPNGKVPRGWAACNGQALSIQQNQALFALLGTKFGGNGTTTFNLPDLRGRVPVHVDYSANGTVTLGQSAGEETHTLTVNEMPAHNHLVNAFEGTTTAVSPQGAVLSTYTNEYAPAADLAPMNSGALGIAGGSQPHTNMQPYIVVQFCIATQGIFPSRS
ncbi:phage tail protein [Tumebacillus flagellatus]|uniref:Tail collar protein n=1 Tax=Tumebacillus flagellatus TaxID=1157490 RepID=A0A074LXC0_9BACL|nr:tail fiber protein [Tumebacillus flagellatus]KEO84733.1 tail collar protein [Tumebacillus flagellatus]